MRYHFNDSTLTDLQTSCLVVGVFKDGVSKLTQLNTDTEGHSQKLLENGDFSMGPGSTLLTYQMSGLKAERVIFVGLGETSLYTIQTLQKISQSVIKKLGSSKITQISIALDTFIGNDLAPTDVVKQLIVGFETQNYRYDQKDQQKSRSELQDITFITNDGDTLQDAARQTRAIAEGMRLTRYLGDLPANLCTPEVLASTANELANDYDKIKTTILEEADAEKLKMGSFLSVAQGTDQPAKFIVMEYQQGQKDAAPTVLVGKGVTFDSGGISLKDSAKMDEMKYDMLGAATVIGVFKAIADMQLPINLIGLIPATENMPSGHATKPGDVFTSMSGQTIEIINTDAEGRLILCDALTYAKQYKPKAVIDIATLTGACIVALGRVPTGLFSNNAELTQQLVDAGHSSGDRVWELPLWPEYSDSLKSSFADMKNTGGREAGSITAAAFLSKFTESYPWVHLDIAGTGWASGNTKGASGRPVPLLVEFLKHNG